MNDFVKKWVVKNFPQLKTVSFNKDEFEKFLSDFSAALVAQIVSGLPEETKIEHLSDGFRICLNEVKALLSQFK